MFVAREVSGYFASLGWGFAWSGHAFTRGYDGCGLGCAWPVGAVGAEPDGGGGIAGGQRADVPPLADRHREAEGGLRTVDCDRRRGVRRLRRSSGCWDCIAICIAALR